MNDIPPKQDVQDTRLGEIYGDIQSVTRIFYVFMFLILIGLIIGVFIVLTNNNVVIAMILAIGSIPVLVTVYLAWKKQFEIAAVFLGVFLLLMNTAVSTKGLGIHSINNFSFPVILIIASLVTSKRTMFFLTSLTVLCIAWLVFGELMGIYTPGHLVHSVPGDFFSASLIVIITSIMVHQLTRALFRSFSRSRKEVDERKSIEADLRQREAILEAVTFAAEQFLKVPAWRSNIDLVLERLGKTLNVTHAYLFEDHQGSHGELLTSMRYEWTAPGYRSDLGEEQFQNSRVDQKGFEEQVAALKRGDVRIGNASSFTEIEKRDMDSLGVKSILEVPVFVNGREWGAIGFDDFKQERVWSNAEVDALKIAAGVLGAAIQGEMAESAVRESERIYRQAIEAAGAVPYYRDYLNHSYIFMGDGITDITGYSASEITPGIWKQLQLEGFPRGSMAHLTYEEADRLTEAGILHHWECDYRMVNRHGQERWVADSCVQVLDEKDARIGVVGILQDVTDRKMTEANLRKRESILEAITFAAEKFLKSPDWRDNIEVALEQLGMSLGVTHTYLFEHHLDTNGMEVSSLRFEWTAPGFKSDLENPEFQNTHLLREGTDSTDDMLRRGEVFIGNSSTFPEIEKERLAGLGIKAMVEMPLFVNGEWWGTIGVDDMVDERDWSAAEIDALKIAAGILSAAIQREMAESAVRESERIYRQAIEAAGAVPYYRDYSENRYTFMGDGIERIVGYKPEEVTVDFWMSILRENIRLDERLDTSDTGTAAGSRNGIIKVWKSDMRVATRMGEERWVTDSAVELFNDVGQPYATVGILQDVTDRKTVEARLRKRESILETVAYAAEQFLKMPDWHGVIDVVLERLGMEFNASHAYLFQKHWDAKGVPHFSIIYEWTSPGNVTDLDNPYFQNTPVNSMGFERMYEILDAGEPLIASASFLNEIEREYLHSIGIKSLLEMRISVNGGQWGTIGFDDTLHEREWTSMEVDVIRVVVNVLGAAIQRQLDEDALKRELSERRRAEYALKLSEEKFSTAFHTTPVFMTIEDNEHRFIDVNQAFLKGFGFEREDVIGHRASELNIFYSPDDVERLRQVTHQNNGRLTDFEIRIRRKSGAEGFMLLSSEEIRLENMEYTLTSGLDITERKLAEMAIQQQAVRAEVLASLSQLLTRVSQDSHLVFDSVVHQCAELIGDGASIFLYSPENEFLELMSVYNPDHNAVEIFRDQIMKNPIRWNEGAYARAIGQGESVLIPFISVEDLIKRASPERRDYYEKLPIHSMMLAPLQGQGQVMGVIGMARHSPGRNYTPADLVFLQDIADRAALAMLNARYYEELEQELAERKRAEQKYRDIFNNSIEGIFQSTDDGRFINVNPAMARIYGYASPEEMLDKVNDIERQIYVYPEQRSDVLERLASGERLVGFETLDYRRDGSTFWSSMSAQAIFDANGNILYYEGTVEDITPRKKAQTDREALIQELAKKNAELEQFTYTVSHDLKSPLVTINGFLGYLEQDTLSGNVVRLKKDIQRIQEAVYKMQRLLNELLELSRIGRMINAPETVACDDLIREAMEIVHGRLEECGVAVHIQPDLPAIYGDRPRLVEVLQNLIDNAAKYMGSQTSPHIEIGQRGEENGLTIFFVRDNGMGIAPEHHERIFGLFNKLDARSEGTGVGLALVKRIIEVHGGRIWVESEAGMGATFLFTLPTKSKPDYSPGALRDSVI